MRVVDAVWEKRNLGVEAKTIHFSMDVKIEDGYRMSEEYTGRIYRCSV